MSLREMYRRIGEDPLPQRIEVRMQWSDREEMLQWDKVRFRSGAGDAGLRYGDNPGNPAALYRAAQATQPLSSAAELLQGDKHPGLTNITDIDAATLLLRFFSEPCAAVMKHGNPSGAARGRTVRESLEKAWLADPRAAFGGALVCNRPLDLDSAEWIAERYLEVVAAPDFADGVTRLLSRRKNLRVFRVPGLDDAAHLLEPRLDLQSMVDGGLIAQVHARPAVRQIHDFHPARATQKNGTTAEVAREPDPSELADLLFGWHVQHAVTSNSVLYCRDGVTIGISTGEQDRVGSAEIAALKAEIRARERISLKEHGVPFAEVSDEQAREAIRERAARVLEGSVMVSDGFFPMPDGVAVGLSRGVTAIAQPGGSVRDADVIAEVNRHGAAMVFTGERVFRH